MEQKIQEIIEENGAKNAGKLRTFDNTLHFPSPVQSICTKAEATCGMDNI